MTRQQPPAQALDDPLIGTRQVAAYLGVSYSTFSKWCARGPACPHLPTPFFRIGGQLRWRTSDLLAWVEAQRVAA